MNEEKQLLISEVAAITAEKDKMNSLVQKLEDRDKNSEAAVNATEKELNLKLQMFEMHKKKVHNVIETCMHVHYTLHCNL